MADVQGSGTRFGPSDFLAAERTFLAWIRTGVALMGFGFVVARFGLFLQALQVEGRDARSNSTGVSLVFGTALIVAGVAVNVFSCWQHVRLVRGLNRDVAYNRPSRVGITIALFLAAIGLALAIYLVLFQGLRTAGT
jgi:putative membrane protein